LPHATVKAVGSTDEGEAKEAPTRADNRATELRRRVALGLQRKLDDDLAAM
jgi:hypothetical protein